MLSWEPGRKGELGQVNKERTNHKLYDLTDESCKAQLNYVQGNRDFTMRGKYL